VLSLYTTVDGGTHWSLPIVFDRHAGCLEANLTGHSMVVTSAGTWWVATTQGLLRGSFRSSNFELLSRRTAPSVGRDNASVLGERRRFLDLGDVRNQLRF